MLSQCWSEQQKLSGILYNSVHELWCCAYSENHIIRCVGKAHIPSWTQRWNVFLFCECDPSLVYTSVFLILCNQSSPGGSLLWLNYTGMCIDTQLNRFQERIRLHLIKVRWASYTSNMNFRMACIHPRAFPHVGPPRGLSEALYIRLTSTDSVLSGDLLSFTLWFLYFLSFFLKTLPA